MADILVKGIKECMLRLDDMVLDVDKATIAGMKAAQAAAKSSVKSGMRGKPRWNHRGPIKIGGLNEPAVTLSQYPRHSSRAGGPGTLTGRLRSAVGAVKRPKHVGVGRYSGGVGVGGPRSVTQVYRKEVNGEYPFMQPGVDRAQPKIRAAYEAAWAKATEI